MKAKEYKNENGFFCVSLDFESNMPDQDIIETNNHVIAYLVRTFIDSHQNDFGNLKMIFCTDGMNRLCNSITQAFTGIMQICEALEPRNLYVRLLAFQSEVDICSYDSTIPYGLNDEPYMRLMEQLIMDFFETSFSGDKLNEESLQNALKKAHKLNEAYDRAYSDEFLPKS
ncbi:hypothetical protein [[Clostridium] innocuum]|uniref:hypothetical protein n=1 Tax=Clostridium innocuum TaxID=1522 RepID=UPI000D6C08E7|nr:hypothetical protein [[Clostridium] innocuum]MCR0317467.1 hypothetical protein [[Clostridium] innocuum]MCR0371915.1 hypothetical protein [[Clostridium] innocuum]MCR0561276.1 hypothetical protein [[Clostridium] innocuum]MCR0604574.1 hypothetical protein [[Clostridium] innocuum]PWJ10150.1 hypothetical protein ATF84_12312 [[Clostridium] innocuum]